jgi:phosphatidylglycerophosphate synthase
MPLSRKLIIIQLITISRAISALLFISLALIPQYTVISAILFCYACLTDLVDGYLSRKFQCTSKTGGILDLFGDKYLTIISLIYAIARGLPIFPCCIAIFREVFLLSMRNIFVNNQPLFPPKRFIGLLTIAPIWLISFALLLCPTYLKIPWYWFERSYWTIGVITFINLLFKIINNRKKIVDSFSDE